jgi:hypothetical protein
MGIRGFCRVTPVHLIALLKRYRQLLGETRHVGRCLPLDAARLTHLTTAVSAVEEALLLCGSGIDLSELKPLPFRPPEPLPNAALPRAVLSVLRVSPVDLPADALAEALIARHRLHLNDDTERRRLVLRVSRTASGLAKRGVLRESNCAWAVQA